MDRITLIKYENGARVWSLDISEATLAEVLRLIIAIGRNEDYKIKRIKEIEK